MIASFLSLVLANAATTGIVTGDGRAMTRAEIREYNAKLERDHPAYIRCIRTLDPGSLVKKTTQCRTNAEWRRTDAIANDDARETGERMASQSWRTSDDPPPP